MTHEVHIPRPGLTHPIKPEGVVMIDGVTGDPVPAQAQPLTNAQLRESAVPVSLASTPGLTDAQLRATAVSVQAQVRTCLGVARLTVPTANAVTLASATGGIAIPVGALTAELQADGGTVRLRRDGTDPTATVGYRLDDGAEKIVDSTLSSVKMIATAANTFCNVAYFDRV